MQNQKMPTDPDLVAADAALRRAALNAKKLAEQQGVPYVVYQSPVQPATQSQNPNEKPK